VLAKTLLASIAALLAVVKAVLVNANLAIQALDTVIRDQDDGVTVTTFNDQHQALKTQITELEVALATAIEAKRAADLAAPWLTQLALTNTALLHYSQWLKQY
jgi:hypothetical protein